MGESGVRCEVRQQLAMCRVPCQLGHSENPKNHPHTGFQLSISGAVWLHGSHAAGFYLPNKKCPLTKPAALLRAELIRAE
ncbi:hypothetical protein PanWU01x14_359700 [Parasponia andersonii]|uniref:Uncharacterized protein n=1 Tax=Parasponia andersonii TaxID=3476 RepID=A0A2P5A7V7_PARAD|nr:hypothetical protein PanWU01x14_359700 [Parasponia andersonii]